MTYFTYKPFKNIIKPPINPYMFSLVNSSINKHYDT